MVQSTSSYHVDLTNSDVGVDKGGPGLRLSFPTTLSWESRACCPCSNRSSNTHIYLNLPGKSLPLMLTFGFTAARMVVRWSWRQDGRLLGRYIYHSVYRMLITSLLRYIDYALKRIRLMRHHKVEPFLVFDGGPLPAKMSTEEDREKYVDSSNVHREQRLTFFFRKRGEAKAKAQAFVRQGRHNEAREQYAKCLDISPQLAFQLIKVCRPHLSNLS